MKLTSGLLKRIIAEEAAKMRSVEDVADDTEEVDADEYADTLEKKIDYVKALKIEESRLRRRLGRIAETRTRVLRSISRRGILLLEKNHGRNRKIYDLRAGTTPGS